MKKDGIGVAALGITMLVLVASALYLGWPKRPNVDPPADCDDACRSWIDITAQHAMSDAAWFMAWLTLVSVAVGAVGILFLAWNLREARTASREARRSADYAESALAAEREGSAAAREDMITQVRAYVVPVSAFFTFNGAGPPLLWFELHNAGQSPARGVILAVKARLWSSAIQGEDFHFPSKSQLMLAAGSGMKFEEYYNGFAYPRIEDDLHVLVEVTVLFTDVFGQSRKEVALFEYRSPAGAVLRSTFSLQHKLATLI